MVHFHVRQDGLLLDEAIKQYSWSSDVKAAVGDREIDLCWQRMDKNIKQINLALSRNGQMSHDIANV